MAEYVELVPEELTFPQVLPVYNCHWYVGEPVDVAVNVIGDPAQETSAGLAATLTTGYEFTVTTDGLDSAWQPFASVIWSV